MKSFIFSLLASEVLSFQPGNLRTAVHRAPSASPKFTPLCSLALPPIDRSGSLTVEGQQERRCDLISSIPVLTEEDIRQLQLGEDVQKQFVSGHTGSGYVAMDLMASPEDIWALLTDYAGYENMIGTVRSATIQPGATPERTAAAYTLSKFKLKVNVVQNFDPAAQQLFFELDRSGRNLILKDALGVWAVETEAEGLQPGHIRLWLCAEICVCRVVPRKIIDYASRKALPRATTWIRPEIESRR